MERGTDKTKSELREKRNVVNSLIARTTEEINNCKEREAFLDGQELEMERMFEGFTPKAVSLYDKRKKELDELAATETNKRIKAKYRYLIENKNCTKAEKHDGQRNFRSKVRMENLLNRTFGNMEESLNQFDSLRSTQQITRKNLTEQSQIRTDQKLRQMKKFNHRQPRR